MTFAPHRICSALVLLLLASCATSPAGTAQPQGSATPVSSDDIPTGSHLARHGATSVSPITSVTSVNNVPIAPGNQ